MDYVVPSFHSSDATQPRAAAMGGAVVAALTAWRDNAIANLFKDYEMDLIQGLESDNVEMYKSAKETIINTFFTKTKITGIHHQTQHRSVLEACTSFCNHPP